MLVWSSNKYNELLVTLVRICEGILYLFGFLQVYNEYNGKPRHLVDVADLSRWCRNFD